MKRVSLPVSDPIYSVDPDTGDVRIRPRQKLLERNEPTVEQAVALQEAHEGLAVATELFQNYGDAGARGVKFAVSYAYDYFLSQGIPPATLKPLEVIMAALVDAENGVGSPIFAPKRTRNGSGGSGRPRAPILEREVYGLLAVVAHCCMMHCKDQKVRDYKVQGAKLAERLLRQSNWDIEVSASRLSKLRDNINRLPKSAIERQFWNETIASEGFQKHPLEWARMLLGSELVNLLPKESQ